jgi:hypothetical protein
VPEHCPSRPSPAFSSSLLLSLKHLSVSSGRYARQELVVKTYMLQYMLHRRCSCIKTGKQLWPQELAQGRFLTTLGMTAAQSVSVAPSSQTKGACNLSSASVTQPAVPPLQHGDARSRVSSFASS